MHIIVYPKNILKSRWLQNTIEKKTENNLLLFQHKKAFIWRLLERKIRKSFTNCMLEYKVVSASTIVKIQISNTNCFMSNLHTQL